MNEMVVHLGSREGQLARVEIVFDGAHVAFGVLRSIIRDEVVVHLDRDLPGNIRRCFVRMTVDGRELYSRGDVVGRKEDGQIVIRVENWLSILKGIVHQAVFSESSTLRRILRAKSLLPRLEACEQEYESSRNRMNCWEVVQCGREESCTAFHASEYDGIFGGRNGGRFCAFVEGTSCKDGLPRPYEEKLKLCSKCNFFSRVMSEEFGDP
ncbi:MAG: hypothetical protein HQL66_11130 [Magnetococcales bacterium]|nr:hypothetical protein [Magnetococcales bacterium]